MIPFSVLDLAPIRQGGDAGAGACATRSISRSTPSAGATSRFWLAEHHNMPGIASAATAVVIGHVAGGTSTIRVGAGGIMLPNHAPLVIAEQFGTLESLYPGRIDLGLGRAPGTDQLTARALRRDLATDADNFPQDVLELQALLGDAAAGPGVRAVPGAGTKVPLWILGSSTVRRAARGDARACRSRSPRTSRPQMMMPALAIYRARFEPSAQLDKPYAMLGVNVFAADTDAEAQPPVHLAAAELHQPAPRHAGPAAAAGRRHRDASGRRPRRRCVGAVAGLLRGRLAGDGATRARGAHRPTPARTS